MNNSMAQVYKNVIVRNKNVRHPETFKRKCATSIVEWVFVENRRVPPQQLLRDRGVTPGCTVRLPPRTIND